jgi:DNA-binding Lrp family transcriptional regulator
MPDAVDIEVLRALQRVPRASFREIGAMAGVSEQTAARRYRALRRDGVARVVGLVNPAVRGHAHWVARIRCRPAHVGPLADTLAHRHDVAYAALASGGTEIICILTAGVDSRQDDLLRYLPKATSVLDLRIDLLIHPFGLPGMPGWTGFAHRCPENRDRATVPASSSAGVAGEDKPLLDALAEDGRATHTELAETTGWSASRVARRLETLESAGSLYYGVDLLPERLGYHLNATLWLRVTPAHLESIGDELADHPEIAFAAATSGEHNLFATVICRDAEDFYRYLTSRVAALPGINGYQVSIRVRRLKQAASLIAHGRLVPP